MTYKVFQLTKSGGLERQCAADANGKTEFTLAEAEALRVNLEWFNTGKRWFVAGGF